jgi:phosphoglycolate phosphatase
MTFGAVLFDLDGTLLDTLADLAEATNCVLRRWGFPEHPLASYKLFVGDGIEQLVRRALPAARHEERTVADCVDALIKEYGQRWDEKTRPYDGIPELLTALVQRDLQLAILSNKPHDMTEVLVARLLSSWPFSIVFGARAGVPKKPDPRVALEIADRLGIPPEKTLYLGDTGIDMKTARAARMFPVGALWGFRDAEELLESGAAVLVERPIDLLDLIGV